MIRTEQLTIRAGAFRLADVNIEIPAGAYCVLMGKTGSGKTTLLEAICGLKQIVSGRIWIGDRDVTFEKPGGRDIGFVPQDGALFQTMTVERHLEFAPLVRRWSREDRKKRVGELARMLEIEHLLDRKPQGLSGGECQRVALGRALAFRPRILCLDEPLSALDDDTRASMIGLLKRVQRETGVTALHVTHNREEAESLADFRLHVSDGHVLEQKPAPDSSVGDASSLD